MKLLFYSQSLQNPNVRLRLVVQQLSEGLVVQLSEIPQVISAVTFDYVSMSLVVINCLLPTLFFRIVMVSS